MMSIMWCVLMMSIMWCVMFSFDFIQFQSQDINQCTDKFIGTNCTSILMTDQIAFPYLWRSSRMSRKSVATCCWFQISLRLQTWDSRIWKKDTCKAIQYHGLCDMVVELFTYYQSSTCDKCLVLTLTFYIILKWNKTSETINMSLPTSDSFCLISTRMDLEKWKLLQCRKITQGNIMPLVAGCDH